MEILPVRIVKMVRELHLRGYESLYLYSGKSPSGINWRFNIGIINNGKWPSDECLVEGSVRNSGNIEWSKDDVSLDELANNFEKHYAEQLTLAKVKNQEYINWYLKIIELLYEKESLVFYADYYAPHSKYLQDAPGFVDGWY